jgi:hypothetical protein
VVFIHYIVVQVLTQGFQSVNHVVNFNAVNELSVMPELCLHSIELGVKFLKIWESSEVNTLNITSKMFVLEQKVDYLKSL